jgi:hypothetical protein
MRIDLQRPRDWSEEGWANRPGQRPEVGRTVLGEPIWIRNSGIRLGRDASPYRPGGFRTGAECGRSLEARFRAGERGSAVLVVLALLFIMAALALGNNRTLHQLHQELDLLEQHQLRPPESVRKPRLIVPASVSTSAEATPSEAESPSPVAPAPEPESQP